MLFNFKNTGIIDSASIEVKGLTVITGLNDYGKSFIGKSIYGVIKTVNEAIPDALDNRSQQINQLLNQIISIERQNTIGRPVQRVQQPSYSDLLNKIFLDIAN